MTSAELVEYAKRRLTAGDPAHLWEQFEIDLYACIPTALGDLSVEVMHDEMRRSLLQQDYPVTLDSSGIGNLLTATGSLTATAGEILLGGVPLGQVRDGDGNLLRHIPHYADFLRPQPLVFGYYCLTGQRIHTRAINVAWSNYASIQGATSPLTVRASFAPAAVSNVPEELEDDLVTALVTVVVRKVAEAKAKSK